MNYSPMLSHNFNEKRLSTNFYIQGKYDGYRCISKNTGLYSRQGNKFPHLQHIEQDIAKLKLPDSVFLDGELYSPEFTIRDIRSIVGTISLNSEKKRKSLKLKLLVFDMFDSNNPDLPFSERLKFIKKLRKMRHIEIVKTVLNTNIENAFKKYTKLGFEGIIIRNANGKYVFGKRSFDVMKMKLVMQKKFRIVGYKQGIGKDIGTVIWELGCKNRTFFARPKGTYEERRKMFLHGDKYIGKMITVNYYEIDKDGCVSRIQNAFF